MTLSEAYSAAELMEFVSDARQRTFDLVADLSDEQMIGPLLPILNPLLWEIGHVAWFQEKWALRHARGRSPLRADVDSLYDSAAIPHDTRWELFLPSREETHAYLRNVRNAVLATLNHRRPDDALIYFTLLSVFHEDMHNEAFTYTRQTLGYPAPVLSGRVEEWRNEGQGDPAIAAEREEGSRRGDAEVPGGTFMLGAAPEEPFVFDNEKWAHPVEVRPFAISRTAVSQREFAGFVDEGGYRRRPFWSEEGWAWREQAGAEHPVHWRRAGSELERRHFDAFVRPLEPDLPVLHLCWYEAEAYCRWAGRRLPTEAEWEMAAALDPATGCKRRFPWGDEPPTRERANLDWNDGRPEVGCAAVDALPAGDSAFGCRQMIGNVWEWTSTDFGPYPGFVPDPYQEYSQPWFGDHKVLRGGCWVTRSRLIRNTWRNFYKPDRRDVWAGFRTCAR